MVIETSERHQEHHQVEIRFVEVVVGDPGQRHVEEDSGHVTCSDIRSITCNDALTLVTDCCEDTIEDDNVDNVSTKGHIDKDELPLLPKIRIYMEEKRPNILPLSLIFSGCITILISGYKFYHVMIPWRDHTFITDEDDIQLAKDLERLNEEPVTGRQFYELYPSNNIEDNTETSIIYFDNLNNSGADKNHVLLFLLTCGTFTTCLGLLLYHKLMTVTLLCGILVVFGIIDLILQSVEYVKNEDTSYAEEDMTDQTQRIMFLALGAIMVLVAVLLYLLHHNSENE